MSEHYNKFDEIPPFTMNTDSSITLNGEMLHGYDRTNHYQGTYAKKGSWPPRHFRKNSPYVLNEPIYGTHVYFLN
jgi:hypothetical protein